MVDANNPHWIISQFLAGEPRTVTRENGGKFTDYWNGLDDNFMPVPPGTYGVKAVYQGDLVRGYWPDPGQVRWRPARTADLDTRVICGPAAQVWYGASWIFSPAETPVELQFQGHPQTYYRWFLNGEKVLEGEVAGEPGRAVQSKPVTLRQGWNQIFFRGYCVGYPPFRAGLLIAAPAETLWTLRLSATPPS